MTVSNNNGIRMYLHCGLCIHEATEAAQSPADYQQIEAGWTEHGLQIWCKRHNVNVIHIDFEGAQHPANTTRRAQ